MSWISSLIQLVSLWLRVHHYRTADSAAIRLFSFRRPAGQRDMEQALPTIEHDMTLHKYWPSACPKCPIKAQCTPSDYRRITHWEYEAVLDAMQARLEREPDAMRLRRQSVEHPFGTLKAWTGSTHFLDQEAASLEYRDELACAGLQP